MTTRKTKPTSIPSEASILDFIRNSPGVVGKREIARAFNVSGAAKIGLKSILKQLEQEGKLSRNRRKVVAAGDMPAVTLIEVIGIDRDGDAYGEPVEWDEGKQGKTPLVLITGRGAGKAPGKGDRALAKIEASPQGRYAFTARVIRTLSDPSQRLLGVFRTVKGHGARLIPVDKKARNDLRVQPGQTADAENGELVEAELVRDRGRGLPMVRVRQRLGDMNDQRNISLIAIHHHGLPTAFADQVLDEVEKLKPFKRDGREDLRKLPLITIDPADARDHDDAVWAEMKDDGGCRVVVAIADVAAYVRPQTALDKEARYRGNSVYFPDRVVPMLPERISNDLCSLREKEERPALACFMEFDQAGHKKNHRFARAIMRSAAKLSYEEAQAAIDGKPNAKTEVLLTAVLKPLWAAYELLSKARDKRSPLDLDLPERKLVLDDAGNIERVVIPPRLVAHRLIEEFMIQANVCAAEELEARRTPLLYRGHEPPGDEKLRSLAQFLKAIDMPFALGQVVRPQHFNRLLEAVKGTPHQNAVNEIVLRTQAQAIYTPVNSAHFGLALRRYAHFTSPIRRYADLIIHRALISALGLGDDGLSALDISRLAETADVISDAERRAMAAERETIDRLVAAHLTSQVGAEFKGRITGVVGAGLFVKLAGTGADGFIPVQSLGTEYFVYSEAEHALIGQRSRTMYRLGDVVEVRLLEAAPVSGGLRFEMVSDGRKADRQAMQKLPMRKARPQHGGRKR
jgi:ribonuclease R